MNSGSHTSILYLLLSSALTWCLRGGGVEGASPIVVNTWPFVNATQRAWDTLQAGRDPMDALVEGCSVCEREQCDGSVGYGGSPDTIGDTTLDAMVMDGDTMDVGSVGYLRGVRDAIAVARSVLDHSTETLLAGDGAYSFAVQMGFKPESTETAASHHMYEEWKNNNCQPNYYRNVHGLDGCGPWTPQLEAENEEKEKEGKREDKKGEERDEKKEGKREGKKRLSERYNADINYDNHDTIGMAVIGGDGRVVAGTTTNGASHKVHGRVGDSPIAGAGAYADSSVGAAVATGDGDVMMRFLPTYQAVESMRRGMTPEQACNDAITRIAAYYPSFVGAILCLDKEGNYAGAGHGWTFTFSVVSDLTGGVPKVYSVPPLS